MRLLVTRPQPEAAETAARLVEAGHLVLVDPLLTIEFSPQPAGVQNPAALIVTSRNAVRAIADWPIAAAWRPLPVFAVGAETARTLAGAGFTDVRVGAGDAAGLVGFVAAEGRNLAGPILYVRAEEPAADIAGALGTLGLAVQSVVAYRAVASEDFLPATRQALVHGDVDGVLFFSARTAATFCAIAGRTGFAARIGAVRCFCLSSQVAAPLRGLGAARIEVATEPDAASLFALVAASGRGRRRN